MSESARTLAWQAPSLHNRKQKLLILLIIHIILVDHQIVHLIILQLSRLMLQLVCNRLHALISHLKLIRNHKRSDHALVQIINRLFGTANPVQRTV